jgi:hypothetical protein
MTALQELILSRERLRSASRQSQPAASAAPPEHPIMGALGQAWALWTGANKSANPGAGVRSGRSGVAHARANAGVSADQGASGHWRAVHLLLKTLLQPYANRKPVQLVASAVAVGALLVWSRPWHWVDRNALGRMGITMLLGKLVGFVKPKD